MKTVPILFPLVIASFFHAPAFAGGNRCAAAAAQQVRVETRVDRSIQEAVDLASIGSPVGTKLAEVQSVVQEESLLYIGAEGECLILQRLEDEIAELRARAQRYLVHAFEVQALQREIVFARLERVMLAMRQRLARGQTVDDLLQTAMETLQIEAWTWIEVQPPTTVRERLQAAIFAVTQAAHDQIDVLHAQLEFFRTLYEARFQSAVFVLKRHIASGRATRRDHARLEAIVEAYAELQSGFLPYDCGNPVSGAASR